MATFIFVYTFCNLIMLTNDQVISKTNCRPLAEVQCLPVVVSAATLLCPLAVFHSPFYDWTHFPILLRPKAPHRWV